MAAKAPAVQIPVKLEKGQAEKDVKSLAKNMFKSFADVKAGIDLASKAFAGLGKALRGVIRFAKESIKLAMTQQESERKLMAAANMRGKFTRQQFKDLQKLNAETQSQTGIGDEVQLNLQAQLALMGVNSKKLVEATRATIGLSEATGSDLNSSMRIVARTLAGNTSSLVRYGIQAKNSTEAMKMLLENFEIAKDRGKTLSGQIKILGANFGDLQENLGMGVAKSGRITAAFEVLNTSLVKLTNFFASEAGARAIDVWFRTFLGFAAKSIRAFSLMARAKDAVFNPTAATPFVIREELASKFRRERGPALKAAGKTLAEIGRLAVEHARKRVPLTILEIMDDLARQTEKLAVAPYKKLAPPTPTGGGGGGGGGGGVSDKEWAKHEKRQEKAATAAITKMVADSERIKDVQGELRVAEIDRDFAYRESKKESQKSFNAEVLALETSFYNQLAQIGLQGMGNAIAGVTRAALEGNATIGSVLQAMFGQIMQSLGAMLISVGTATVIAAAASTSTPMLWGITGGPSGVAAGLGLIAAGGILTGVGGYIASSASSTKSDIAKAGGQARTMSATSQADSGRPGAVASSDGQTIYNINFNGALPGSERRIAREIRRIVFDDEMAGALA